MPCVPAVVAAGRSAISDERRLYVILGRAVRAGNDHVSPDPEKVSPFIGFAGIERNPARSFSSFRFRHTDILDG